MKRLISKNALLSCVCTVTAVISVAACSGDDPPAGGYAQVVYKNGKILTVDHQGQVVQSVAIKDKKIISVGTDKSVNQYIGKDTKVIDLGGKTMIPGIYDAHSHFSMTGMNLKFEADLNSPPIGKIQSIEEIIVRRIQTRSATPVDSVNEGGVLRAVDQQFSVHSQR